ncbi:predicted protein [Lichtheimia corymbifera JMRC:FSU:9682]|uniref:Uncharacterized protein n=1 Tax=Lichtheimia corymbifera JMRC:FSU:9682 TaxID=1263082 RepID=A0A068S702_9FUNG|nr:predicted protein [Lichtheimia corymbifera JMRC:FSU:9682]
MPFDMVMYLSRCICRVGSPYGGDILKAWAQPANAKHLLPRLVNTLWQYKELLLLNSEYLESDDSSSSSDNAQMPFVTEKTQSQKIIKYLLMVKEQKNWIVIMNVKPHVNETRRHVAQVSIPHIYWPR